LELIQSILSAAAVQEVPHKEHPRIRLYEVLQLSPACVGFYNPSNFKSGRQTSNTTLARAGRHQTSLLSSPLTSVAMAPRGKNTIFRVTGLPIGAKAADLLQSAFDDLSFDNDDAESAAILKETLSSFRERELSDDQQAESFLRAAICLELTADERKRLKIKIEIIPCCYNGGQRSALVHFVGSPELPQFTLDRKGKPRDECQISVDTADINFDLNFYGFTQMYATEGDITAEYVLPLKVLPASIWFFLDFRKIGS
jgi:hypothetical protein